MNAHTDTAAPAWLLPATRQCLKCERGYMPGARNQKFCQACRARFDSSTLTLHGLDRTNPAEARRRREAAAKRIVERRIAHGLATLPAARTCRLPGCGQPVPADLGRMTVHCSTDCKKRARKASQAEYHRATYRPVPPPPHSRVQ